MFKIILLLTPAIFFISGCLDVDFKNTEKATNHQRTACYVVGISDGDTLTCLTQTQEKIRVRLHQIDAPEKSQDFGNVAKQALSNKVFNKNVELKIADIDRYGRTVAEIYLNNQNINKQMVAEGMAWAYREYLTDQDYARLESVAKENRVGLWSMSNPIYPSQFRKNQK